MFLRKSKWMALILTICLGMAFFTGCGSGDTGNGASNAENSASTAENGASDEGNDTSDEGNGASDEESDASDEGDSVETEQELQEYVVEGIGTFYLPEGFTVESGVSEEGLPMNWAVLSKDSVTVSAGRFGTDAYEAAGVPLPADLEEYSQRDGVRQGLPEGVEFEEDDYGNLYVEYVQDGNAYYNVLKQGTESFGSITIMCPEGEMEADAALWASKMILE